MKFLYCSIVLLLNSFFAKASSFDRQGSLYATQRPLCTTQGSLYATQGSLYATQGSLYATQGSLYATQRPLYATQGSLYSTQRPLYATQGSLYAMQTPLYTTQSPLCDTRYANFDTKYDFIVAQDGSGNFKTVQEAINAVPDFRKVTTTIFIKNGTYKEKLNLSASKQIVTLIGENVENTILTYDDWAQKKNLFGEEKGTSGSSSFYVYGPQFTAHNITFQNAAGPVGQAVALFVAGDKARFFNCRMLGFQDTLYTYGYASRQYYYKCYIEGTVDFIFGSSTAVFEECEIFGKKAGYYTAASTPDSTKYGYVFINSKIHGDAPEGSFYLGRPWRPYAKTVFIGCDLGKQVKPEGWHNWNKPDAEKTSFYAEYKSKGLGANDKARVKWAHQLTEQEVNENFSLEKIFNGWKPN